MTSLIAGVLIVGAMTLSFLIGSLMRASKEEDEANEALYRSMKDE